MHNLYDQADKLVSKSAFPENAGNNQAARYAYYLGRIKALQLAYTQAHTYLTQAIRKAPQNNVTAGFQQTVSIFHLDDLQVYSHASLSLGVQVLYRGTIALG